MTTYEHPFNLTLGDPCPVPDCPRVTTDVAEDLDPPDAPGTGRRLYLCTEHKQNLVSELIRRKQADDPTNSPWETLDQYWEQVTDPEYRVGNLEEGA